MTSDERESRDFLKTAEDELRRLLSDDRALQAQEEGVRRKRAELGRRIELLRDATQVYRDLMGIREDPVPSASLFERPIAAGTIGDMAIEIMRRYGKPMKVADLTKALEATGRLSHGGGPESARGNYGTVYGTISRDRRFRKTDQGEFWLADDEDSQANPERPLRMVRHSDGSFSREQADGSWRNADGSVTAQPASRDFGIPPASPPQAQD